MLLPTTLSQCFAMALLLQQYFRQQIESFLTLRQAQHPLPNTIECGERIGKLTQCVRARRGTPAMVDSGCPCFGQRKMVREHSGLIVAATPASPFHGTAD